MASISAAASGSRRAELSNGMRGEVMVVVQSEGEQGACGRRAV
jgi:hypothetical protein